MIYLFQTKLQIFPCKFNSILREKNKLFQEIYFTHIPSTNHQGKKIKNAIGADRKPMAFFEKRRKY